MVKPRFIVFYGYEGIKVGEDASVYYLSMFAALISSDVKF